MYVDLRQQNVPNRSYIKIVLRAAAGQAGCAKVPQLTTVGASTCVEPAVSVIVANLFVREIILLYRVLFRAS